MKHMRSLKVGDRVAFSALWLKSTQTGHDLAKLRGTLVQIGGKFPKGYLNSYGDNLESEELLENFGLVQWDRGQLRMVNLFNMAKLKSPAFADAPHMGKTVN
jgi:hypothetical protein